MPLYSINTDGRLEPFLNREWLLTNGMGAFAMGGLLGCNLRRYHGLLCAATLPPVGRVMALNRVAEIVYLDGDTNRLLELSINDFGGHLHPRGERYLRKFEFGDICQWTYDVEGASITKEVQLLWQRNVAAIRYTIDPGARRKARLELLPFASLRDFHGLRKAGGANLEVRGEQRRAIVHDPNQKVELFLQSDAGQFIKEPDWWYDHFYSIDAERGQDCREDLFKPGKFVLEANGKSTITLWASIEPLSELPDWQQELDKRDKARATAAPAQSRGPRPVRSETLRRLLRASEDFIVARRAPDGSAGTSVLAGYPWFADWGRDTFISLPGLLLETGRFEQARQVLKVFGEYVSEGMIPNRFDDYNGEPHYNTVDASLWYIHAAFAYLTFSKDHAGFEKAMLPACRQIIDGYRRGTRFSIRMEADGLITQGDQTTQLTWMDAKMGDVVFTPRQGKAVEINALWYHALMLMGEKQQAQATAESFRRVFWISPFRGLADVADAGHQDTQLRPNQIFAVSLPNSPLTLEQQQAVVEVVRRELLTPAGLRTLAQGDPNYKGHYTGDQFRRDGAYHNGTVWPWLIGPFLSAYLRVNNHSSPAISQAKQWLQPILNQMEQNCIGQIAEICEGDPPHRPVGCPAQAWSVAEALRVAVELGM